MRKICVVTSTRADYGILYHLLKAVQSEHSLELQIIATGMHLSQNFGLTYKEIEKDFKIDEKIEILSGDSDTQICKSIGLACEKFGTAFGRLKPDILVLLGDRYEIFAVGASACVMRIPTAHIHGGETTQGAFDEVFRHSLTKMSHLHFVATEEYKKRVIQLGEHPDRVFNVGGIGIENIKKLNLLSKAEFEKSINFKLGKKNILVTFHPVTLENGTAKEQFNEILNALNELKDTNIIFTKANSDTNGLVINKTIEKYVKTHKNCICFTSLGQLRYLSALKFVDIVLGNSSSGLTEAPSFKVATVNIGDRQKGRIKAGSVIDCEPKKDEILGAINKAYSSDFRQILKDVVNPYDGGDSSKKIVEILKNANLDDILKKKFYDIE